MAKKQKFMRTDFRKYSKLGVRRKKKQKYRRAKGIDNKIRLKMKGHLRNVSVGFRSARRARGLINELKAVMIYNLKDLKKIGKGEIGVVAKVGNKKRKEILEHVIKHNVKLTIDTKKALKKIEDKMKEAKEKRQKVEQRKKVKEKKAKGKKVKKERVGEGKEDETKEEAVKHETDIKENVEEKK